MNVVGTMYSKCIFSVSNPRLKYAHVCSQTGNGRRLGRDYIPPTISHKVSINCITYVPNENAFVKKPQDWRVIVRYGDVDRIHEWIPCRDFFGSFVKAESKEWSNSAYRRDGSFF